MDSKVGPAQDRHMSTSLLRRTLCNFGLAALAFHATIAPVHAQSQDWPTKPVKIVVPFAAGGSIDSISRLVATGLQAQLGQPVTVENKAGEGALIGAEFVARAASDGYTLLVTSAAMFNSPILYGRTPYDWQKDFTFITTFSVQPLVLLVKPTMPARTMTAFLAQARKERMTMGTAGEGLLPHLAGLLLEQRTGVRFEAAHYRLGSGGLVDLMAGQIQFQFEPISTALPLLRDGKLRALAVTSLQRSPALPDVPTIAETVQGYEAITVLGLAGPASLPAPVEARVGAAVKSLLDDPIVQRRFDERGAQPRFSTPEAFLELMREQADIWIPVIRKANLKVE
jgi:tripartite-type tricarboxylate transporter receptor subunit TctC